MPAPGKRRSTTVTAAPACASRYAVADPTAPAPMMTIDASLKYEAPISTGTPPSHVDPGARLAPPRACQQLIAIDDESQSLVIIELKNGLRVRNKCTVSDVRMALNCLMRNGAARIRTSYKVSRATSHLPLGSEAGLVPRVLRSTNSAPSRESGRQTLERHSEKQSAGSCRGAEYLA